MSVGSLINTLKTNIFGGGNSRIGYGTGPVMPRRGAMGINETPTPLDKLQAKNDPMAFSTYQYPQDIVNNMETGHYMLFYVNVANKTKFNYYTPSGDKFGGLGVSDKEPKKGGNAATSGENDSDEFMQKGASTATSGLKSQKGFSGGSGDVVKLRSERQTRRTGISAVHPTTTRITDSVAIYLPPNVQDNYGVTYTNAETGLLGALAAGGVEALKNIGQDNFEGLARNLLQGGQNIVEDLLARAGLGLAETLTSAEGGYELANKIFQRAANPYMEVLFQSVPMRTFTYNFHFAPKDPDEQQQVRDIIKLFRFHMAPELRAGQSRFFTLPSEFDIHYMFHDGESTKQNSWYNKIATCVLTSCNVDYSPGGVNSHADGSPVKITMGLTFQETEMITKDHIVDGF
tara:strand:- start:274 stop:1479 length:1206 start_codon:yes stop_codon:yes gene_type:complete